MEVETGRGDHRTAAGGIRARDIAGTNATQSSGAEAAAGPSLFRVAPMRGDARGEAGNRAVDEMRGNWSHETVRLLENWAMWLANDRKPVSEISPYPAYRMSSRGKRAGNVIPIISMEAEKADAIICAMAARYQKPLRMHYGWAARSDRSSALACNCCVDTYKSRLNEAHRLFEEAWYAKASCCAIS
jgi:hypothetical protein